MRPSPPDSRGSRQSGLPRRVRRRTWRLRAAMSVLALSVAAFAIVLVLQETGRLDRDPAGTSANPSASSLVSAETSATAASPSSKATTTQSAKPSIAMKADPGSYELPVSVNLSARTEIALPEPFKKGGWELVHILPDGRLILNSGRRLSIIHPATGQETLIKEAEFGIQAAANDRFVAFGIGGDEVTEIYLHQIGPNYTEVVLRDKGGYLDLEMTRADGLLASRIRYTGEEAVLDAWIRFDAVSYKTAKLVSTDRSYAKYLFRARYPSKNADWTYDIGRIWHQAWLDSAEQLFYAETVHSGHNDFSMKIYRSMSTEPDMLLFKSPSGPMPDVLVAHNLLVIGRSTAYRTDTGRWIRASFETLAGSAFPYGGMLLAARADGVLVAALDRLGHPNALYRLPPAG
jgi:hypothetical protein